MRANGGIQRDLDGEGKRFKKNNKMKKMQSAFGRKGDVIAQVISTTRDATVVNTRWKDGKTNMEIKKPCAVVQYSKFVKGVDREDQYLSLYSVLGSIVKWSIKVVLYLLTMRSSTHFFVYRTLNKNK
jgi:hypothetical protein